jgi:hypothetical protein
MNDEEKINRLREMHQLAEAAGDTEVQERIRNALYKLVRNKQVREETSPGKAFLVGAANKVISVAEGAGMLYDRFGLGGPDSRVGDVARENRAAREERMEPLREARPFSYGAGNIAPSLAIPGGGATRIAPRLAGAAAAAGGEEYVESGGDPTRAAVAAGAGVLGNEVARLGGRLAFGPPSNPNTLTSAHREQLNKAKELGYRHTPATIAQDPRLHQFEAAASRDPFMSGPFIEKVDQPNQEVANRMAREAIGLEGSDKITDDILQERHATLGSEFERVVGKNQSFPITDSYYQALDQIEGKLSEGVRLDSSSASTALDRLRAKGEQQYMTVADYQQTVSDLASLARSTTDPATERVLYAARDALDYEFDKTFGDLPGLVEARAKWRNLRDMERSKAISSGDFRPTVFYNYRRRGGKHVKPGTPLNDLAITANYGRNPVPNSGTPTGQAVQTVAGPLGVARLLAGPMVSGGYLAQGNAPMAHYPLPNISDILMPKMGREAAAEAGVAYGFGE